LWRYYGNAAQKCSASLDPEREVVRLFCPPIADI